MAPQSHAPRCPFGDLFRTSIFLCMLVALWLPFGSLWVAFGRFWLPFGSTLVAFGTLSAHFGTILAAFGSILDPLDSIFDKKSFFGGTEFAHHLQIAVRTPTKKIFLTCMPLPPGPDRELAVGNLERHACKGRFPLTEVRMAICR